MKLFLKQNEHCSKNCQIYHQKSVGFYSKYLLYFSTNNSLSFWILNKKELQLVRVSFIIGNMYGRSLEGSKVCDHFLPKMGMTLLSAGCQRNLCYPANEYRYDLENKKCIKNFSNIFNSNFFASYHYSF